MRTEDPGQHYQNIDVNLSLSHMDPDPQQEVPGPQHKTPGQHLQDKDQPTASAHTPVDPGSLPKAPGPTTVRCLGPQEPKFNFGATYIRYRNINKVLMDSARAQKTLAKAPDKSAKPSKAQPKVTPSHRTSSTPGSSISNFFEMRCTKTDIFGPTKGGGS